MTGSFTVTVSYDDYVAANWLLMRRRWLWRGVGKYIGLVGVIFFIIGITTRFLAGELDAVRIVAEAILALLLATGTMTISLAWFALCVPRNARRVFSQMQLDKLPTTYTFDDTGIRVAHRLGTSDLEWAHLTKWLEGNDILVIWLNHLALFCIPKLQVDPATLDSLRSALRASGVPDR